MKKLHLVVVAFFLLISCTNNKKFQISGTITNFGNPTSATMLYLKIRNVDDFFVNIDSTFVKDDGSFVLKGVTPETDLFFLTDQDNVFFLRIFVEPGNNITITGSATDIYNLKIEGSKTQTQYFEYLSLLRDIDEEKETIYHNYSVYKQDASISEKQLEIIVEGLSAKLQHLEELTEKASFDFIRGNENSVVAAYLVYGNALAVKNSSEIEKQLQMLSPSMNNKFVTLTKKHLEKLKLVERGKVFPNVELPNTEGELISLESFRGKYVLVDFWATWCGPCLGAIPNLKKIYQQYHHKGFEIYGISLDQNREAWLNGIAKLEINWVNVSDLLMFNSPVVKQMVVTYIPHTFLLDPNGVILAVDINDEELEKILAEKLR